MDSLRYEKFSCFNHNDVFFDTLKESYVEFSDWLNKKALSNESAYLLYDDTNRIDGFLYLKPESNVSDVEPSLPGSTHLKIGTFKFESKGTLRGQRFIKKVFDTAIALEVDNIYVTIFEMHDYLIRLFKKYGFYKHGEKHTNNGIEFVYVRDLTLINGDILLDYPLIVNKTENKYLLSIYPEFHTRLFPDSRLLTEPPDIFQDVSHANSIHKIYICAMKDVLYMKRGDIIVIYRTADKQGPARYRSVISSLCVVEEVRVIDEFQTLKSYIDYCGRFSVFSESELTKIYKERRYPYIVRFTYNVALPKRIIRDRLINEVGLNGDDYWGVMKLTNDQFNDIIRLSEVNESFIIN
ncbi:N-acetyltransferase [Photorhabdus stackebrandtii]|uniref:N-acetyltransferase n=1 Tax=Photorhabdus stackebrandtii TaxID=1123042 RepID=A0A7X5QN62_9GAMM|nr:N-acetyltransferase [Photorhabdus stackebrandtii]NHB97432.1 N-acetyltransferase [Photorhabdus stackebrandtii]